MKFNPMPPIERVRELLAYCPETGRFTWKVSLSNRAAAGSIAGSSNDKGYIEINIDGRRYKAHRLAWFYVYGEDPGRSEIDHQDLNKGNNAIGNLRLATRKQNNENIPTPSNNQSGFRGVSYRKGHKKWEAYIYHNKKRIHLGFFESIEAAAIVRSHKERQLFTHSHGITAPKEPS